MNWAGRRRTPSRNAAAVPDIHEAVLYQARTQASGQATDIGPGSVTLSRAAVRSRKEPPLQGCPSDQCLRGRGIPSTRMNMTVIRDAVSALRFGARSPGCLQFSERRFILAYSDEQRLFLRSCLCCCLFVACAPPAGCGYKPCGPPVVWLLRPLQPRFSGLRDFFKMKRLQPESDAA